MQRLFFTAEVRNSIISDDDRFQWLPEGSEAFFVIPVKYLTTEMMTAIETIALQSPLPNAESIQSPECKAGSWRKAKTQVEENSS